MEFPYVKCEGERRNLIYRPCLPVTFCNKGKRFPVGSALVDTGADTTILPRSIAHFLGIELDDSKTLQFGSAGGGVFAALPSRKPITHLIERKGFRSIQWEGTVYFADNEKVILLGHHECLEKFDLTFQGPEKILTILLRFKA